MAPWGLRVSIIEPGAMRTPIIEGRDRIKNIWNTLSSDTQERWGEDFVNQRAKKLLNDPIYRNARKSNESCKKH